MSQSANSSSSTAAAISQRTVGVSFDLPPLKWNELKSVAIDAQPVFDHIKEILPKLAFPAKNISLNWPSNDRKSTTSVNWYPQLENTPEYLRCRHALNDLQVTLDQGPLGSCVDFERNRIVLVGAVVCIGNMFCFILPPRTLYPSGKRDDLGVPIFKGRELRPRQTSTTGSPLLWKLDRSSDNFQVALATGGFSAGLSEQLSPQAERQLGPPTFPIPGNSRSSSVPPPSIDPISPPPDILSQLKAPVRTWFPDLRAGLQLKLTNDFQVTAQVYGNPVKGVASLAIKPALTRSVGLISQLELPMFLNVSNVGQHPQVTGGNIGLSVKLRDFKAGLYFTDPTLGIGLQINPGLSTSIGLTSGFGIR